MEKQTMKVMCNGATVAVFVKPFCNDDPVHGGDSVDWFFKNVNGLEHYNCKYCTPVPEKKETDLERAREAYGNNVKDWRVSNRYIVALEDEISRLTAGVWTEDEARGYALYCVMKWTSEEIDSPSDWLAARRKEKECRA